MRPLWPGTDRADSPSFSKSMGQWPAVWAASRTKGTPRRRQTSPTAWASWTAPLTLEPWAMTSRRVLGRIIPSTAPASSRPALSQGMRSKLTPSAARSWRGRMTALCSTALTRQWSPGRSQPRRTMFSPMVLPQVRIQWVGSPWPKRRHSPSRSSRVVIPASWALA